MKAIVVGGGIGGLSLALSLHQIGFEPHVFESARAFQFLGLGINVQPHAVRELTELGLGGRLAGNSIATAELAYFNKHGQLIWSEPRGLAAGYKWPQHSVSRSELQKLLLDAAQTRLGPDRIRTGHHLATFAAHGDGVIARFIDRATGREVAEVEGDFLVGADGIHSAVRHAFSHRKTALRGCHQLSRRDGSRALSERRHYGHRRPTRPAFCRLPDQAASRRPLPDQLDLRGAHQRPDDAARRMGGARG
jgi:2-polyprenyl-6-methoxyphenol hydroxylase-like FAD-dependent oxidoreductase